MKIYTQSEGQPSVICPSSHSSQKGNKMALISHGQGRNTQIRYNMIQNI